MSLNVGGIIAGCVMDEVKNEVPWEQLLQPSYHKPSAARVAQTELSPKAQAKLLKAKMNHIAQESTRP